jgi:hypothetical protein
MTPLADPVVCARRPGEVINLHGFTGWFAVGCVREHAHALTTIGIGRTPNETSCLIHVGIKSCSNPCVRRSVRRAPTRQYCTPGEN